MPSKAAPELAAALSGTAAPAAAAPAAAAKPEGKPTDDRLTPGTSVPAAVMPVAAPSAPAPAAVPAPTASRMPGFALPSGTGAPLSKPVLSPAAQPVTAPAVAAAAPPAPAVTPAKVTPASSRAAIPRLNRNTSAPIAPHPLAAAYPGYDVVVCIAGCGPQPTAVSIYKPKLKPADAAQGGVIRVAMNTPAPVNGDASECVAGCYDSPAPRSRAGTGASAPAAVASPGSPVGATDRSVMVQTSASPAKPIATAKPKAATPAKAAPKKPAGSEWFTRRFEKQPTY